MQKQAHQSVLVAMSGGVDSAGAALLLCRGGYTVQGVTMRLQAGGENGCCTTRDIEDARAVAAALSIPFSVCDFSERFYETVISPFMAAYEAGQTPNPCINCNRYLKFEALYRHARASGCDAIATGHYARVRWDEESGRYQLLRARDAQKDQSYVLYHLTQEQLAHTLFPLGELCKDEVRALAAAAGLSAAHRKESQDICFVPDGDYAAFMERTLGKAYPPGNFVTKDGRVLGQHRGIIRYTVGQRKGLGLALPAPLYVCSIRPEENLVVLGEEQALYQSTLLAHDINLLTGVDWQRPQRLSARVRYRQREQPATVTQIDRDTLRVVFDTPQRAITPGQAVVLYDGDVVAGGGVIAAATP